MPEPHRARVPVEIEAAGDTHIGGRPHNEDALVLRPDLNLFVVADGAGGKNAGNVASSLAVTTIAHFFEETAIRASQLPLYDGLGLFTAARRLSTAVQMANDEIIAIAKTSDRHRGMGTTVVAALLDVARRWLHLAWVGDSRCYRFREGRLELLTFDHSLINDVLELRPNIADERVKKLPQNVITRALGMSDSLRVSVRTHELLHDDQYLICSDGLSDVIEDGQIAEALAMELGCDGKVELLMNMALDQGAEDNVACAILDCTLPSGGTGKSTTRPLKKKSSQPRMPKVTAPKASRPKEPSKEDVTEESVPEIVLYDRLDDEPESSPLIHVVPAESTTPEVVDALEGVMSTSPEPAESSPLLLGKDDERGTEPGPVPSPKRATNQPKLDDDPTVVADDLDDMAATQVFKSKPPSDHTERGGAAAGKKGSSTTPRDRASEAAAGSAQVRTGDTRRAPDSVAPSKPGTLQGAGPEPKVTRPRNLSPLSRPRSTLHGHLPPPPGVEKQEAVARITGKGSSGSEPSTKTKGEERDSTAFELKKELPPMREPLATNEFILEDTVSCHACGSIISKTAEICMYCGATTGFVPNDD